MKISTNRVCQRSLSPNCLDSVSKDPEDYMSGMHALDAAVLNGSSQCGCGNRLQLHAVRYAQKHTLTNGCHHRNHIIASRVDQTATTHVVHM